MSARVSRDLPGGEQIIDPDSKDVFATVQWLITDDDALAAFFTLSKLGDAQRCLIDKSGGYKLTGLDSDRVATATDLLADYAADGESLQVVTSEEGQQIKVEIDANLDEHQTILAAVLREVYDIDPSDVGMIGKEDALFKAKFFDTT